MYPLYASVVKKSCVCVTWWVFISIYEYLSTPDGRFLSRRLCMHRVLYASPRVCVCLCVSTAPAQASTAFAHCVWHVVTAYLRRMEAQVCVLMNKKTLAWQLRGPHLSTYFPTI